MSSALGGVIPVVATRRYDNAFDLAPQQPLAPNTTYTLQATLPARGSAGVVNDTVTFTTGGATAAAPAIPTGTRLHYYSYTPEPDSCGAPATGTCVSFPDGVFVVANYMDHCGLEVQPSYLWQSSTMTDLTALDASKYRCVSLRTRAADGVLSQPYMSCLASTQTTLGLTSSGNITCTSQGIVQDGQVREPGYGCGSFPAGTCRTNPAVPSGLALMAIGLLRRRRKLRSACTGNS